MLKLSNKVNALKQQMHRKNKNIKNLKELLLILKEKQLIASEETKILNYNFGGLAKELFSNQMKNPTGAKKHVISIQLKPNSLL